MKESQYPSKPAVAAVVVLSGCLVSEAAHAYVDPGSGSVIVTTILGLIAAVGYTARKYFYKAKRLFRGKDGEREEPDEPERS